MSHWYLVKAFQSRIARRITFWVFGSLLAIEAIILLPSYVKREHELLDVQHSRVVSSLDTAITPLQTTALSPLGPSQVAIPLEQIKTKSQVIDYAIFEQTGDRITPNTDSLPVSAKAIETLLNQPALDRMEQTYDTAIRLDQAIPPLYVIVRHDTAAIQQELNAYTGRMLSMILLISVVVTVGTMVGVERLVIRPVLYLQEDLILASDHIRQGLKDSQFQSANLQRNDELGEVINAFEHLHQQIWQAIDARTAAHQLEQQERDRADQLNDTLHQLHATQSQLVQAEKMSGLGQLVAGVAHEINNPINFIHGNLKHSQRYVSDLLGLIQLYQQHYPTPIAKIQTNVEDIELAYIQDDLPKLLESMKKGSERVRNIVLSLRNFSRLDESGLKSVDIHQGIESSLALLTHRLEAQAEEAAKNFSIQIVKEYSLLPLVECEAGLLNQVFMNILANAIDAIEKQAKAQTSLGYPGKITIRTALLDPQWVQIAIANNGTEMAPAEQKRIFDPFFTTKPVGQGTGMGLSISYQIVTAKHQGTLTCCALPGQGTEFVIQIPIKQNKSTKNTPYKTSCDESASIKSHQ